MKFICVRIINDVKGQTKSKKQSIELKEIEILKDVSSGIYELSIPLSILNSRLFDTHSLISKLKAKSLDNKIIKNIRKIQESDTYYILPKFLYVNVESDQGMAINTITEYIQYIFNTLDVSEYKYNANIKRHVDKYVEHYIKTEKVLPEKSTVVLMYKRRANIDFNIITYLIGIFKNVEIYLEEKTNDALLKRIENINMEYGSSIKCISRFNNPKTLYSLCLLMDSNYTGFRRHKILNAVPKIELYDDDLDMFDENVLKIKDYEKNHDLVRENVRNLSNIYGKLKVASILVKIL